MPRTSSPARSRSTSLGVAAPDDAHRGHHAGHAGALSTRAHGASVQRAAASPLARASSANDSRAPATRCRTAPSCSTEWLQGSYIRAERNPHYWNNAANRIDGVKYLQIADENAELRAYRAGELHCTCGGAARAVRLDPGKSGRRAARVAAAQHLLLRLQSRSRRCSRTSAAAPGAVDGRSTANAWRIPCCAWASCRPTAGCRPACYNYTAQTFDYAAHADGGTHRRRAQAAGRGGISRATSR